MELHGKHVELREVCGDDGASFVELHTPKLDSKGELIAGESVQIGVHTGSLESCKALHGF